MVIQQLYIMLLITSSNVHLLQPEFAAVSNLIHHSWGIVGCILIQHYNFFVVLHSFTLEEHQALQTNAFRPFYRSYLLFFFACNIPYCCYFMCIFLLGILFFYSNCVYHQPLLFCYSCASPMFNFYSLLFIVYHLLFIFWLLLVL